MNYNWNWHIYLEPSPDGAGTYVDVLLSGLRWTILTSAGAWVVALTLGSCIGIIRTLPNRAIVLAGNAYVELFRNIPLLVQLFIWFFVLPQLLPHYIGIWIKRLHDGPFYTAVLGIGLYMSARVAIQVAAGIETLPRGQQLAGFALGLTRLQTYRYVLLPMAFRIILPPLTSDLLNTIKNTSVALTIGLAELTASAHAMQEFSFQVFEAFSAAVLIYLALNAIVTASMVLVERGLAVPGFIARR